MNQRLVINIYLLSLKLKEREKWIIIHYKLKREKQQKQKKSIKNKIDSFIILEFS